MTWMMTASGKRIPVLSIGPEHIDLHDIAAALAKQCRFNGHCRTFYSVAEHSVRVAELLQDEPAETRLWGLLHDAAEAYLGDMARPVKHFFPAFSDLEKGILIDAIAPAFALPPTIPAAVKRADDLMLEAEWRDLMPSSEPLDPALDVSHIGTVLPVEPGHAEHQFLECFSDLSAGHYL